MSPIKQEPMTPTKPQIQSVQSVGTQQQGLRVCKQEPVPLTEMDANTEVTPFDHAMTEQILSAHVSMNYQYDIISTNCIDKFKMKR